MGGGGGEGRTGLGWTTTQPQQGEHEESNETVAPQAPHGVEHAESYESLAPPNHTIVTFLISH